MTRAIIGIDCAVDPRRTGLALAFEYLGRLRVEHVVAGLEADALRIRLSYWMAQYPVVVLALDAPLGWPSALGTELAAHHAGEPIDIAPDELFRRATDREIKSTLGKQPLDVGADRIARTAVAALDLLQFLRDESGVAIPVAVDYQLSRDPVAIEVYPAGTLKACGLRASGYKQVSQRQQRVEILTGLTHYLDVGGFDDLLLADDNALDAVICALAGFDFLNGKAAPPRDRELARKEGWIWVRRPA